MTVRYSIACAQASALFPCARRILLPNTSPSTENSTVIALPPKSAVACASLSRSQSRAPQSCPVSTPTPIVPPMISA